METSFYFLAIIPPEDIYKQLKSYQKIMSEQFGSHKCLHHIPHLTLIPPFELSNKLESKLINLLDVFSTEITPVNVEFNGFSHFKKHTLFADVIYSPKLNSLQSGLLQLLNNEPNFLTKSINYFQKFNPHITIAYRDLKPNFAAAWDYFKNEKMENIYVNKSISLLKHNGKKWEVISEF